MINFILDYLEDRGVYAASRQEQRTLEAGISEFLEENGIRPDETRTYHRRYAAKLLDRVAGSDLKSYLLHYHLLRRINQIIIEVRAGKTVTGAQRTGLYQAMEQLHRAGLGEKYVPIVEIRQILGKFA